MTSTEAARSNDGKLQRWLLRLAIVGAIVGVCLVTTALALRYRGSARRDMALEGIRARGEPLQAVEALDRAPRAGADSLLWLKALDAIPYVDVDLQDVQACAESFASSGDQDQFVLAFEGREFDATCVTPPTPCDVELFHHRLAANSSVLGQALALDEYTAIDWKRVLADDDTMTSFVPKAPIAGAIKLVKTLSEAALDAALRDDAAQAARRLELTLRAAALFDDSPFLLGHSCWTLCHAITLAAIARTASLLPRGTNLDSLASRLAALEPRAQLRRALLGQRALGIQMYAAIRNGTHGLEGFAEYRGLSLFLVRLWFEHDEADYLEEMARAIGEASNPRAAGGETKWEPRFYSLVCAAILPRWNEQVALTASLDAKLLVTRAALIARRDGFDAARTWAAAQRDPFSDQSLHTRIDADGALSIWSVGPNGKDDGGPLPPWSPEVWGYPVPPDILVRCAPR